MMLQKWFNDALQEVKAGSVVSVISQTLLQYDVIGEEFLCPKRKTEPRF